MTEVTTTASSSPAPAPSNAEPAAPVVASPAPPADASSTAVSATAPTPPAGLDVSYWDGEKGAVRFDALAKDLADLKTFKAEASLKLGAVPESPDKYEFKLPEGFALPEGISIDQNDPRLPAVREMAHKVGLNQSQFEALIQMDVAAKAAEAKQFSEAVAKEKAALGPDGGKARIEAVSQALGSKIGIDHMRHLNAMIVSRAQVEAMEALVQAFTTQGAATGGYQPAAQGKGGKMSQEEWDRLSPTEKFQRAV